jgi:hypothetical protein
MNWLRLAWCSFWFAFVQLLYLIFGSYSSGYSTITKLAETAFIILLGKLSVWFAFVKLYLIYSSYLNGYSTITRSALIILIGKMHQPIIPTQDNILILESMGHVNFKNVVSNTCFSSFLEKNRNF